MRRPTSSSVFQTQGVASAAPAAAAAAAAADAASAAAGANAGPGVGAVVVVVIVGGDDGAAASLFSAIGHQTTQEANGNERGGFDGAVVLASQLISQPAGQVHAT